MHSIVAFNLAKVDSPDASFFYGLHEAFADYDARLTLYTTQSPDEIKSFSKRFDWVILNIENLLPLPDLAACAYRLDDQRRNIWEKRVAALSLQGEGADPKHLVEILERLANHVLLVDRPDVILSWNTLCPHSGILADLAREQGYPVYLLERGFLDQTWFLERGGLVGHSTLVDRSYEELIGDRAQDLLDIGQSYLEAYPFDAMSRYVQQRDPRFDALCATRDRASRPMIGFFPPDDLSLGFLPTGTEDQRRHVPSHDSSLDAAIALAAEASDCDVIFKPHPSFRELNLPEQIGDNLYIMNHSYHEVMARCDVVASTGSGLVVPAMAMGKPVLSLGRDQFSFKTITYDAQTEIRPALDAALNREGLADRLIRFQTLIGYALTSYLTSAPDADTAFRRPADVVRDIMHDCFGHAPAIGNAHSLGATVSEDRSALFDTLAKAAEVDTRSTFLVDFDHTLLFGNSTEAFLDTVRPRQLFLAVHWLLMWLMPWRKLARDGISRGQIFDPLRVVLCIVLAPWSLILWRQRAKALIWERSNTVLLRYLKAIPSDRVTLVSNGHPWVLKPLLRAMGLKRYRLVCGNVLPNRTDIRRLGKLAACARRIQDFDPDCAVTITDSRDDADLLGATGQGFLIDWRDVKHKADTLGTYFPMVMTDQGKYAGANVVTRHRFQEDLPVVLLAFALTVFPPLTEFSLDMLPAALGTGALAALACIFLFVSLNAVYEIGYWENDFVAAMREANPNVSPQMARFESYPFRPAAWIWAGVSGAIGVVLAAASGIDGPLERLLELPSQPFLLRTGILFVLWCGGLFVLRRLFRKHNFIAEPLRIYTFWALHSFKLLAYVLVFSTTLAGIVLVTAQVFRHWPGYLIYRFRGDKDATPRYELRAFFFLALSGMLALAVPLTEFLTVTWLFGAWFFLRNGGHLPFFEPLRRAIRW
ncbi:hypothetical protein GI582_23155 [Sulfitobacter sp. BDSS02]|nr:hypothetical protein [Sulfitobacter sp. BDSS02]